MGVYLIDSVSVPSWGIRVINPFHSFNLIVQIIGFRPLSGNQGNQRDEEAP